MEREMFYLFLCEILWCIRLQRHAVVAHSLRTMPAKSRVPWPRNLSIFLVEAVVES